jgi:hypothetical protein
MKDGESLIKQLNIVFLQIDDELGNLASGIIFVQIRNNMIGKFGIRHDPFETSKSTVPLQQSHGLSELQRNELRRLAVLSLYRKVGWTHGEIQFEFALRQGKVSMSITFESNYNMSNLLSKYGMSGWPLEEKEGA